MLRRLLRAGPRGRPAGPRSHFQPITSLLQLHVSPSRHFSPSSRTEDVGAVAAAAPIVAEAASWTGPVDVFAEYLKLVHSSTGLPWWQSIPLAAVGVRLAVAPLVAQQTRAADGVQRTLAAMKAAGLDPKDPSALAKGFPALRRAAAASGSKPPPSALWILAAPAIQIPIFVTGVLAVRRIAGEGAEIGLAEGGALWFPDLTARALDTATMTAPMGTLGIALPALAAGAYFANVQLGFGRLGAVVGQSRWLGTYRLLLEWLALPSLLGGLTLPHVICLYWLPNNCFTLAQTGVLRLPAVRRLLLGDASAAAAAAQLQQQKQKLSSVKPSQRGAAASAAGAGAGAEAAAGPSAAAIEALSRSPEGTPLGAEAARSRRGGEAGAAAADADAAAAAGPAPPEGGWMAGAEGMDVNGLVIRAAEAKAARDLPAARSLLSLAASHKSLSGAAAAAGSQGGARPRVLFALGEVCSELRDWQAAEAAYERSARAEAEPLQRGRALLGLGVARRMRGDIAGAITSLREAAAARPGDPRTHLAFGSALLQSGELEKALEAARKAAQIEPRAQVYVEQVLRRIHAAGARVAPVVVPAGGGATAAAGGESSSASGAQGGEAGSSAGADGAQQQEKGWGGDDLFGGEAPLASVPPQPTGGGGGGGGAGSGGKRR